MIAKIIKSNIQKAAQSLGYHILSKNKIAGDMELFLKGIKSRGFKAQTILDIGAHKGEWSQLAHKYFENASFYLIEPQQEMKPYLDKFFENKKGQWFLGGAGAEPGVLTLAIWDDYAGSSFLFGVNEQFDQNKQYREVPIYSMNQLIKENKMPRPNICKIDVQGFELEVLKGCTDLFDSTEIFIIEASIFQFMPNQPILHEIVAFMANNNYIIYDFAGFSNRPFDGALGQIDICFVKKNTLLSQSNTW